MKILSIGTSGRNCTIAISEDKRIISEINISTGLTHSETLLPNIEKVLKDSSLSLKDMDAYAISIGPGSFTGIRICIATVKGLCLGVEKPVIAVPSLLALAYNKHDFDGYIVSCIDARNDNVYAGVYKYNSTLKMLELQENYISDNVELLIDKIKSLNGNVLVIGDGKKLVRERISEKNIIYSDDELDLEYATSISNAAFDLFRNNIVTDGIHVSPLYLKKSQAERELEEKEKTNS